MRDYVAVLTYPLAATLLRGKSPLHVISFSENYDLDAINDAQAFAAETGGKLIAVVRGVFVWTAKGKV